MEKIGYVYLTTNLVNGKQYVGQHLATEFDTKYKGSGHYIKRAFEKYGWDNFTCEVLQWCSTQTQLNEVEDNCIRLYVTMFPEGYNLKGGGSRGRFSKEARKNVSNGHKKYFKNPENRKKNSESKKKYWENEENRKKASEAKKSFYESEEGKNACNRISESVKKYFENEENRQKQSEAHKGKKATDETRIKQSEANKKRFKNPEERKKQSEASKKCWKNEEYRKKQSKSQKNRFENPEERKKISESNKNHPKLSKRVYQYTKGGVFLKEWVSTMEIQRVLGFDNSKICACCNYKRKSAYDCLWSYEPLD